jgi:hypothetical protein
MEHQVTCSHKKNRNSQKQLLFSDERGQTKNILFSGLIVLPHYKFSVRPVARSVIHKMF